MTDARWPPRGEIRGLTGLRFVAALWVVAHHFWLFSPDRALVRHLAPLRPLLENGWLGVDLFFVLSGFVLAHNYVAVLGDRHRLRATASFYWARLSRIWPTWMVVLGAVVAGLALRRSVLGTVQESHLDVLTLVRQVLLVQVWDRADYSATGPVGPAWSLSAEWLAYLFFPLVVLLLYRLRTSRPAVLGGLAVAALAPFVYGCLALGTHDWRWSWLLRLAGAFLSGALVALFVQRVRVRVAGPAGAVAGGAVAVLLVVLWGSDAVGADLGGVAVLVFPVVVGAIALTDARPARWLATPAAVLGGRISFALYLVHMAVFQTCWTVLDAAPGLAQSPAGGMVRAVLPLLPLPVAWLLWRLVEEPARRRMRRLDPFVPRRTVLPTALPADAPVPAPLVPAPGSGMLVA